MPSSAKQDRRTVDDGKDIGMKKIINECIDIRSLESLARLHVMIAQILENNSREAEGHVLTAAYCVRKVWQVLRSFSCIFLTLGDGIISMPITHKPFQILAGSMAQSTGEAALALYLTYLRSTHKV